MEERPSLSRARMLSASFFPSLHEDVVIMPEARVLPSAVGKVLQTFLTLAGGGWGGGRGYTGGLTLLDSVRGAVLVDKGRLCGPPVPSRGGLPRGGTGAEVDLVDGGAAAAAVGGGGCPRVLKPL